MISTNNIGITLKDVKFTQSGIIASNKAKNGKTKLLSHVHILGYKKDKRDALAVICLEYGFFAEGKNKQSAIDNLISLVTTFLVQNSTDIINRSLEMDTPITRQFWTLYRRYEKVKLEKMSIDISKIEKKETQKITIDELSKKYQEEIQVLNNMLDTLMKQNMELRKKTDNHYNIIDARNYFIPDSEVGLENAHKHSM